MTQLHEMTLVDEKSRTYDWEEKFFHTLSLENLKLLAEAPEVGPDGWPYLLASTAPDASESAQKMIHWASDKGIGLVINPTKDYPDYVFTYGMLWNFRQTGRFISAARPSISNLSQFEITKEKGFYSGHPSEDYFPQYARGILRSFFKDQGLMNVKCIMVGVDDKNFDLVFSLESLGIPPKAEHQGILEAISWFMPPHYSLALMSEKGLPPFVAL